jgi:hypothetical protein
MNTEKIDVQAGVKGWLEVRLIDKKTGEKTLVGVYPNLITNVGLAQVALLLEDAAAEPFLDACIGEGTTAAQNTDTDLEDEVDNQTPTVSRVTTSVTNDTAQFVSLHEAPAGGWAITEYGIKTVTAHILLNHVVFAAINLSEGNELEFTYKVQAQRVS